MEGVCKTKSCEKHGKVVQVHRGSWFVAVPKCHSCGKNLHRTMKANKELRSRISSVLPGHLRNR